MFSSAVWCLLCKSGLLSRIVQSRHSVLFVIVGVNVNVNVLFVVVDDTYYYKQNRMTTLNYT